LPDLPKPVTKPPDDRSAMAQAVAWSSRVTTVSLEMVLPGAFGYWLDQKLGTWILFTVVGAILGMTGGMIHLLRLTASAEDRARKDRRRPNDTQTRT